MTLSKRYIAALAQLPQFLPGSKEGSVDGHVTHLATGVEVSPAPDPNENDHGLINLSFADGRTEQAAGALFLDSQLREAVADNLQLPVGDDDPVIKEVTALYAYLSKKHDL